MYTVLYIGVSLIYEYTMCIYIYVHNTTCAHIYNYIHTYIWYIIRCICVYICIYTYTSTCVCIHIYIYMYICKTLGGQPRPPIPWPLGGRPPPCPKAEAPRGGQRPLGGPHSAGPSAGSPQGPREEFESTMTSPISKINSYFHL